MGIQAARRMAGTLATLGLLLLGGATARADVVTLNGGGTVQGNVVAAPSVGGSKAVAVRTTTGGLIVFEQNSIKQVKHGTPPAAKAAAKAGTKKPRLTAEEQAWMPKVRTLLNRLGSPDRNLVRRARSDLLDIHDADALPALSQYLGGNRNEEIRRLYVVIVRDLPGTKTVYSLVALSIFDASQRVRDEARQSIGAERADAARVLYIDTLKSGEPNLASLAARGIAEVGDPNGEAIPYLIANLLFQTTRIIKMPDQLYWTTPPGQYGNGPGGTWLPPAPAGKQWGLTGVTVTGPVAVDGFTNPPAPSSSGGRPGRPSPGVAANVETPSTGFAGSQLAVNPGARKLLTENNVNPAVLDALVRLTKQDFGPKVNDWRRWWENEKKNRDAQQVPTPDRVISKPPAPR